MISVSSTFAKRCFIDSATGAADTHFVRDCFLLNNSDLTLVRYSLSSLEE